MNCCDHNECCGHSDDRIGAEIGMLHNLLRRQMACMTEKTANAANVTGMQAMIVHHLIIHEKQGDIFQKDLENAFQMRRSTATGILQLMEQHGIIRREPVEHDGRLKRLVLTEQARAMDEYITERMQQMERLLIIFSQHLHGLLPWHTLHGIFLLLARQLPPFFSVLSFLV